MTQGFESFLDTAHIYINIFSQLQAFYDISHIFLFSMFTFLFL